MIYHLLFHVSALCGALRVIHEEYGQPLRWYIAGLGVATGRPELKAIAFTLVLISLIWPYALDSLQNTCFDALEQRGLDCAPLRAHMASQLDEARRR